MHGLGNDFMVVDATRAPFEPDPARVRALADRHTGVGFDQLLVVAPPSAPGVEFDYRIFNADGAEVEHCGNGARCFARFVRDRGLTTSTIIPVRTAVGDIRLELLDDGRVTVLMGVPEFDPARVPFVPSGGGAEASRAAARTAGRSTGSTSMGTRLRWASSPSATRTRCSSSTTSTVRRWRRSARASSPTPRSRAA